MGTQTMGSQGTGNTSSLPKSYSSPLSTQNSLYNLTLDEVQTQFGQNLGKPLTSMNLDELLRTVWIAESSSPTPTTAAPVDDTGVLNHGHGQIVPTTNNTGLITTQSSFSLSQGLRTKTVDEVWREIQQGKKSSCNEEMIFNECERQHNSLGEMTLEDFLVHAGVVVEPSCNNNTDNVGPDFGGGGGGEQIGGQASNVNNVGVDVQQQSWMQYQQQLLSQQMSGNNSSTMFMSAETGVGAGQQQNHVVSGCGGLPVQDSGYSEVPQMVMTSSPLMSDTQAPTGRKRTGDVVVEKTVERRQKRMIKNRESAARSRARKQAYTNELENKVSRLEEENRRLRSMKEVEKALPPPPKPKFQLRRSSSVPF